ncbi:MAG: FKBP-type peptidyl-prolyl cis-trans isomerase [Minwuia sp.]|uniref:FKBP-type peptidyl-prolyl cis-trans isomerase n=1 Tax=Minwuia sp. TaxID=2493630 RepID=UPI003A892792
MIRSTAIAALMALAVTGGAMAQDSVPLDTVDKRYSYMIGLRLADQLKQQGFSDKLDIEAFTQAMRDTFAGRQPRLSSEEMQTTIAAVQARMADEKSRAGEEARARGQAFLEQNRGQPGVTTKASGLQYLVTTNGSGPVPGGIDTVRVHYEGRLLDGTVFDSSYQRGEPAVFRVGQVIPGWQEALQMMPAGSKWEVWIPSDLAYGAQGAGDVIGPNEVLNFTIELIEIVRN